MGASAVSLSLGGSSRRWRWRWRARVALGLAATCLGTTLGLPAPAVAAGSPGRSSVTVITLPSRDEGRSRRSVWVYRPATADSASLPVLYLLHGQAGHPEDPFSMGLQRTLDEQFAHGWRPFVVAVPQGGSAVRGDDEWGNAADGSDRLESFVTGDVVRAVEGAARRDRAHRAIAGFSMGGYAAAYDAALHRDTYGQVVSLAGYFRVDDPEGVWGGERSVEDRHYPLHHPDWLNRTRVLLLDSDHETEPVVAGQLTAFRRALSDAGHPPGARVTPGSHDWTWVSAQWPLVVRFLSQGWGS